MCLSCKCPVCLLSDAQISPNCPRDFFIWYPLSTDQDVGKYSLFFWWNIFAQSRQNLELFPIIELWLVLFHIWWKFHSCWGTYHLIFNRYLDLYQCVYGYVPFLRNYIVLPQLMMCVTWTCKVMYTLQNHFNDHFASIDIVMLFQVKYCVFRSYLLYSIIFKHVVCTFSLPISFRVIQTWTFENVKIWTN